MGVHGLWKLIEPSGKPVPLETLENKVLAVDVSIWLHQAIKGFQDSKGGPVPNAHLLGIYHRVCKLLYFRIRPVFIFDGGVPNLKKDTIAKRNNVRNKNVSETYTIQKQLLNTLLKHSAVNKVISEKAMENMENSIQKSPEKPPKDTKVDDIFKLPNLEPDSSQSSSDEQESVVCTKHWDLDAIDEKSSHFKSLPADVRHEILTELKATRKQSSWGRLHELPTQSDDFSIFQMRRLLKRHSVQISLEDVEKEMGGHSLSLGELEALLTDHGVITSNDKIGNRIASDENARYLLIKDVKKALEEATNRKEAEVESEKTCEEQIDLERKIVDSEYEKDLKAAIQLSLRDVPSTSKINTMQMQTCKDDSHSDCSDSSIDVSPKTQKNIVIQENVALYKSSEINVLQDNLITEVSSSFDLDSSDKCVKISDTCQNNKSMNDGLAIPILIQESTHENVEIRERDAKKDVDAELISDSESDSLDNFIEVTDESLNIPTIANKSENCFEVVIKPKEVLEDDIFSDIFQSELVEDTNLKQNEEKVQNSAIVPDTTTIPIEKIFSKENVPGHEENDIVLDNPPDSLLTEILEPLPKDVTANNNEKSPLSVEQLKEIRVNLIKEKHGLVTEKSNKERLANNITDQMYQDAQFVLHRNCCNYLVCPIL